MNRSVSFVWVALVALFTVRPASASPGSIVLPLGMYLGLLPSLQVEFGGRTHTLLLDTGGGLTVVTPASVAAIG